MVVVLVIVLIAAAVLVVLILVLVLVLIIHFDDPPECFCGDTAVSVCPVCQDLSLGLKIKLTRSPEKMAAVIPPADAFRPPMKIPGKPWLSTAFRTPSAKRFPKPVRGTVAPAPANSERGLYRFSPPRITPATT